MLPIPYSATYMLPSLPTVMAVGVQPIWQLPLRDLIARCVDLPNFADKALGEVQVAAGSGHDAVRTVILQAGNNS